MITVLIMKLTKFVLNFFLTGISLAIPDSFEDNVVRNFRIFFDGMGALIDAFAYDVSIAVLSGIIAIAITLTIVEFVEDSIRRIYGLIMGESAPTAQVTHVRETMAYEEAKGFTGPRRIPAYQRQSFNRYLWRQPYQKRVNYWRGRRAAGKSKPPRLADRY